MTYEYKRLINPTDEQLNALAADGWRIVQMATDARDGSITVFMERERDHDGTPTRQHKKAGV